MKKIILMFLIIILAVSVFAAGSITSTISQNEVTIDDINVAKTITISVTNNGADTRTIQNVIYEGFSNAKDTLNQNVFSYTVSDNTLDAGETETVTITIDLSNDPTQVYASDYVGTIKITTDSQDDYAEEQLTIHVTDENPSMSSQDVSFNMVRGSSSTQTRTLTNTGNVDLTSCTASVSDLSSGTDTIPSSSVIINPNAFSLDFASSLDIDYAVTLGDESPGSYIGTVTFACSETTYSQQIAVTVNERNPSISFNDVTIEEGPSESFSKTISVVNDGNVDLNNLHVVVSDMSDYSITVSPENFNLNAGQSKNVIIEGKFPEDLSTGDVRHSTITISNEDVNESAQLTALTIARLELKDVVFDNGDKDKTMNNNSIYSYLKPGDELKIEGTVKNTYSDDITLENVEVEVTINDIDDGDDISDTASLNDLDKGDDDDFTISFNIPYEVRDNDEFDVDLVVRAEDENGGSHELKYSYVVRINRDTHDIIIKKADFDNPYPKCGSQTTLNIELMNLGSRDEDEVTLEVKSTELGITEREVGISMDSNPRRDDNKYTKTYTFDIPENTKPKTYLFTIKAYYNTDTLDDQKTIPLEVRPCATTTTHMTTTTRITTTTHMTTTTKMTTTTIPPQQKQVKVPEFKQTSEDSLIIMLLSGAIAVGVVLIILMLYMIVKK